MSVVSLDHINIRTADPGATVAFFRDVLAMEVVLPSQRGSAGMGGWVLDGSGAAVLHVGSTQSPYPSDGPGQVVAVRGGGAIHHVALRCSDYDAMRTRFEQLGVDFRENTPPGGRIRQLFVDDPNGLLIELSYVA